MDWILSAKYYAVQEGLPVFLVRTGMNDPNPVGGRDEQAEDAGCSHFLSFHLNSSDAASAYGSECYYRDAKDKEFAKVVHGAFTSTMNTKDRGLRGESEGQHSRLAIFDFDGPACLEEIGFITNARDRAMVASDTYRKTVCRAVIRALVSHYGIEGKE